MSQTDVTDRWTTYGSITALRRASCGKNRSEITKTVTSSITSQGSLVKKGHGVGSTTAEEEVASASVFMV